MIPGTPLAGDKRGYPKPKCVCVCVCTCLSGGGDRDLAPVGVVRAEGDGVRLQRLRSEDDEDLVFVAVVTTVPEVKEEVGVALLAGLEVAREVTGDFKARSCSS